jgi:putative acetyltransferase
VIAYDDGKPVAVACGCFREMDGERTIEIKRMYVAEKMRGRGIAKAIIHELEKWAAELGEYRAILETGINQPEAIDLYTGAGYGRIKNYGPYINNGESVCMGKDLPGIPLFFVSQDK